MGLENLKYTKNNDLDILASAVGTGNLNIIKYLINYDIRATIKRKSVHDIRIVDLEPVLAACELPYILFEPIILYLSLDLNVILSVFFNIKNDEEYNKKRFAD